MNKLKFYLRINESTSLSVRIISVLGLLIFISRLIYVPFINEWDIEFDQGFFGFRWLSSFLSVIGNEIAWMAMGLFVKYLVHHIDPEAVQIKKYTSWLANLVLVVAIYFMCWAFYDSYNFSLPFELLFACFTSIAAFYVMNKLFFPLVNYIQKLLGKIRMLTDIIILEAPNHVTETSDWEQEVVQPTLDKLNE